ncbi:MAG: cell division protein FtsW [Pasteurellales bacterium]|nr:MAG: cell division protein FtsW [Pasteurellales bacterium]
MFDKLISNKEKWFNLTSKTSLYDRTLIWIFFALLTIGFVMVTSASIPAGIKLHNNPLHFISRDVLYILLSIPTLLFFVQIPSSKWEKYNVPLFLLSLVLLLVVLFIGHSVNGSTRWIRVAGINFQPAELAKLTIICYFAGFYVRKFEEMRNRTLGSTAVIFVLTFGMLFIIGAKLMQFLVLSAVGGVVFFIFVRFSEYRLKRVQTFLDPWADAYGDGFQLTNAQMAFGQGELFGKGLGNSVQKLGYLPEAHTDFIMAIAGEELGMIGILGIITLFVLLSLKAFKISKESLLLEERFKGFFSFGIGVWIFLQSFVNLSVATGLLPTKGLTFPLISYGGSSLIVTSIVVAILLRIDYENRLAKIEYATPRNKE